MFKHVSTSFPYFEKVDGPWSRYFFTQCAVTADVNRDGIDDLIVCHPKNGARYVLHLSGWTLVIFSIKAVTKVYTPPLLVQNIYTET